MWGAGLCEKARGGSVGIVITFSYLLMSQSWEERREFGVYGGLV